MKNLVILGIILLLVGVFFFMNKNIMNTTNNNGESMNNKPVVQSHKSNNITLLFDDPIQPHKQTVIRYVITDENGHRVKEFVLNHEKLMHFIVVRSDLQDFQHLHPDFNESTGEFTVPITFADNGKYRLFADFIPANGQKDSQGNPLGATPYTDITVGNTHYAPQPVTSDTERVKTEGEYTVTYAIPQSIQTGKPIFITMNVSKNGQPVTDMEEYLGAQAHGILLKKDTLDFAHLHAMGGEKTHMMGGKMMTMHGPMPKGPEIKFEYTFPASGIYKLFTQFQYQGKVITVPYVIEVQ